MAGRGAEPTLGSMPSAAARHIRRRSSLAAPLHPPEAITWAGIVGTSLGSDGTGSRAAEQPPEVRTWHVGNASSGFMKIVYTREFGIAYRAASTHPALRRVPLR